MRKDKVPHWHILGAGSIGCLWASKLLQSGFGCSIVLRPETFNRLTTPFHNLTLVENGVSISQQVQTSTTDRPGNIDNLIVTTKAFHALEAVKSVSHQLTSDATIILLQNGIGSQQVVTEYLPDHCIYAGSTTDGAWLDGFLSVQRAGKGKTWLGSLSSKTHKPGSASINCLTALQDMDIELTDHIQAKLQEKLAINSAINGLTALINCQNGDLLKRENLPLVRQLCDETEQILQADGYLYKLDLFNQVRKVLSITADNISSTLQDVRQQRQTELAWINGYLLKVAERHKISAKGHTALMGKLTAAGIS